MKALILTILLLSIPFGTYANQLHIQVEGVDESTPWGYFDLMQKVYVIHPEGGRVLIEYDELIITGNKVEYSEKEGSAIITGNVSLQQEDFKVESGQLLAKFKENIYLFEDNVVLHKNDYRLLAQTLKYWEEEEKLEAKGDVVIHFSEGSIRGNHFIMLLEDEKVSGFGAGTAQIKVE